MDNQPLIEVSHLSRTYPGEHVDRKAVNNISFTLDRGQVLGFLGPNGAGKSTTMQMLTDNLAPSSGRITIGGVDLLDNPIEAKSLIGYLPDTPPLYKEMTVDEYLFFCARLNRIPRSKLRSAVAIAKEKCGLTEQGKTVIGHLSKGFQQRTGIAQAIIHTPEIVILDEPTVGLDPIQMIEIRKLIKELGETHSVMLSSHVLTEIQTLCSDVQIIHQGQLIFNASIHNLERGMQPCRLCFCVTSPVDTRLLLELPEVTEVTEKTETSRTAQRRSSHKLCYTVTTQNQSSLELEKQLAMKIIELSHIHNWGLYEIFPNRASLEDIFISLTHRDPASNPVSLNENRDTL